MAVKLFLLVNATLFIRPAEVIPALEGLPIYNALISACLMCSLIKVSSRMSARSLGENPIDACVVGLFAAVALSNLVRLDFAAAKEGGVEFAKVVLYYFLLVATVDTPARLREFLRMLAVCTVVLTVLALLQYHGVIDIPALQSIGDDETDPVTGRHFTVLRLCSTGIYHDPNDLCLILLLGMGICLFGMGDRPLGPSRLLWGGPLVLFGYALTRTHSRGGFLALLSSMGVLFVAKFGVRKAIPLGMVALPAVLAVFAGRQTSISASDDTGQDRIQLWSAGLLLFRQSPLFGIGQNRYAEEVGLVAHNSFVHAFTELGILGGTLFTGAFYYGLATLQGLGGRESLIPDPEMRRLRPYLMAMVAAYATCLLTISRNYIVPTYMLLGLVSIYLRVSTAGSSLRPMGVGPALAWRFAAISGGFLVASYAFVRAFARFGG